MVNQLPAQLSCQTCGNFATAAAILAGNRDGLHSGNGLLIHFHGCTSAVSREEITGQYPPLVRWDVRLGSRLRLSHHGTNVPPPDEGTPTSRTFRATPTGTPF